MASTAEGQHDGVTTAGPENTFTGASAHPEVTNTNGMSFQVGGLRQPWQAGNVSTAPPSGFALGPNRPD